MFNREDLQKRIYAMGFSQGDICKKIKMSIALFSYRLGHPDSFKVGEIKKIGYLLGMSGVEIYNMFIAGEVHGLDD